MNFLSAHDMIFVEYKIKIVHHIGREICCRDYSRLNKEELIRDVCCQRWDRVYASDDVDTKVRILNELLMGCFDRAAPKKSISFRKLPVP